MCTVSPYLEKDGEMDTRDSSELATLACAFNLISYMLSFCIIVRFDCESPYPLEFHHRTRDLTRGTLKAVRAILTEGVDISYHSIVNHLYFLSAHQVKEIVLYSGTVLPQLTLANTANPILGWGALN
jgi:hypothetical protein